MGNFCNNLPTISECLYSNHSNENSYDLTIAIPTYKRDDLLFEAICSVEKQEESKLNLELIIIDNDKDKLHVQSVVNKLKKIKSVDIKYFVNNRNIGLYGNWNACINNASSNIVALLHDDDILFPFYLREVSKIIEHLKKCNNWVYIKTKDYFFSDFNEIHCEDNSSLALVKYTMSDLIINLAKGTIGSPTCGSLFNKQNFLNIGGFEENWYPSADVQFVSKALVNKLQVYMTSKPLGAYRLSINISKSADNMIKTMEKDDELLSYISNLSLFAKAYVMLFKNARLENTRRVFVKENGSALPDDIKTPKCSPIILYIYKIICLIKKNIRIITAKHL